MKQLIALLFILALSTSTYAQEKKITAQEKFKTDLKNNTVSLYVLSGIVSKATPADEGFQKKFGVKYHDFGCVVPMDADFYEEYNKLVFTHLKKRFAKKWEKDIRKDAMGFDEWNTKPYIKFMPIPPKVSGSN
jgi:hypothetical protein